LVITTSGGTIGGGGGENTYSTMEITGPIYLMNNQCNFLLYIYLVYKKQ